MFKIPLPVLIIFLPLLLIGCSSSNDNLDQWMQTEGSNLKGAVTPLPPVTPFIPTAYIGTGLSDPFAPKKSVKNTANAPDSKRKKDFLENFSLDKLTMVGTIQRKGQLWALIKTPDRTVSMAKQGDFIGLHFGKIKLIGDSGIKITENVLDPQGDWSERDVDIPLNPGQ